MAVQANDSTLADTCRYWLFVAKELGEVLNDLPQDYQEHIIWAVSVRAKEQDTVLLRMALFLDPRFRQAASSSSTAMPDFLSRMSVYAASQGWEKVRVKAVLGQLAQYAMGKPPYDLPCASGVDISGTFSVTTWWEAVHTCVSGICSGSMQPAAGAAAVADLAELATVLCEIVPHAALPERVFSTMGWYEGGKAVRLSVGSNAQKTAIKMHYDNFKAQKHNRSATDTDVPAVVDLTGPANIPAAVLSNPAAAAAAGEAAVAQRNSSAADLLQAASDEEGDEATPEEMQAALTKQYDADEEERHQLQVPPECRRDWRAALQWAMGVEQGQDLLNPNYQEVLRAAQPRQISAPVAGIDPLAIAQEVLQEQQQAAAAATAAAQQLVLQQALQLPAGNLPLQLPAHTLQHHTGNTPLQLQLQLQAQAQALQQQAAAAAAAQQNN